MAYTKTSWINDAAPPISAANLNKIEQGIADAHSSIASQASAVSALQSALTALSARVAALEDTPTPLPVAGSPYGSAMRFDALGNTQIGGTDSGADNVWVSFYFRAAYTGTITGFRAYWLDEDYPGYGGGNGGTFNITLQTDSAGKPSGTALATITGAQPTTLFPVLSFPSAASVTAGQIYHLVFKNTDASPTVNFSSINMCWNASPTTPRTPRWPDGDWGMVRKFFSPLDIDWGADASDDNYSPVLELHYGDGRRQGNGYVEVEVGGLLADGANQARLRFTPSRSLVATGAMVRCAKNSGGSGDLTITLQGPTGTALGTKVVSGSSITTSLDSDADATTGEFVGGDFASPVALSAGVEYRLRLTGPSGSLIWSRGIQNGSAYGFDPVTYFDEASSLEVSTNSGSTWSQVSGLGDAGCLQFYLT